VNISQLISAIESLLAKAGPPIVIAILQALLSQLQQLQQHSAKTGAKAVDPAFLAAIEDDLTAVQQAQAAKLSSEGALTVDNTAVATAQSQLAADTATDTANQAALHDALAQLLSDVTNAQPTA
jgi:hypothetical protein